MRVQQTRELLESLQFSARQLLADAACLRRSHSTPDGGWDEPQAHEEHQACLFHAWRIKNHAESVKAVLRRHERAVVVASGN